MTSTKVSPEDYVTIVSVGNSDLEVKPPDVFNSSSTESPFVTVLSIGSLPIEEEVTIFRLPGEKLGFGLKFEGGTKSAECVRRLFIQSCTPDSPAGRAKAAWGPLEAGDEILRIDNFPVTSLTRLECVRCLKDSNVAVTLFVRHDVSNKFECEDNSENLKNHRNFDKFSDTSALPPPVPPRKTHKKQIMKEHDANKLLKNSDGISRSSESLVIENSLKKNSAKNSPYRPRKPISAPSPPPPEAQVYTDLFSNERENGIHVAESESDDTGSSISTVIDRLSLYSSFPGSVESSIPSTPTLGAKQLNFQNVFSCLDSIGQSLLADMPPSIVDEKMKPPKSPHIYSSHEKLPLTKTKSNTSDDSLPFVENGHSLPSYSEKFADFNGSDSETAIKTFEMKDSNNNKKIIQEILPAESRVNMDTVDGCIDVVKIPVVEAPKPKPRMINKKNLENTFGQRKYDENLSLTKIHCIESWLQDSCKVTPDNSYNIRDDGREIVKPEALPRLIDFVPKSTKPHTVINENDDKVLHLENNEQNKENANNLRLVITRDPNQECGNNAGSPQLETIYEDLSACPTLLIEESSRHPPAGDSGSDQGNHTSLEESHMSVVEVKLPVIDLEDVKCQGYDKTLTTNEESEDCAGMAVTRGPRSPPDGRENPAVHHDDASAPLPGHVYENNKFHSDILKISQSTKPDFKSEIKINDSKKEESVGRHPKIFQKPTQIPVKDWEKKFTRGKDEKCNGSVKDKIAMFSANKTSPPEPSHASFDKKNINAKKADTISYTAPVVARSISIQIEPLEKQYCTYESKQIADKFKEPVEFAGTLPRTNSAKTSLSFSRALSYDSSNESRTNAHKNTLNQLIEQRRQSMSKLRGLVIPDSPRVLNLPEIKSKDSLDLSLPSLREDNDTINNRKNVAPVKTTRHSSILPSWESQPIITNIPKYSPAFKRKPLQVYGPKLLTERNGNSNITTTIDTKYNAPSKPPRTSLDSKKICDNKNVVNKVQTLPTSFKAFNMFSSQPSNIKNNEIHESKDVVDCLTYKSPKPFSDIVDSDNDSSYLSTVSSPTPSLNTVDNTESDCSSQSASTLSQNNDKCFHKNGSIYEYNNSIYRQENGKTSVCRSLSSDTSTSGGSSNSSTLTSGSQASCSSAGSTDTGSRILKPRSIEAINRKNILASAKCRSGKDKYGSPLIERKFSDVESTDEDTKVKKEHVAKPKSEPAANSVIRVAYSTLVEDKFSQNETDTYSDDSDCDYGSVTLSKIELSQRYSNGLTKNNTNKIPIKDNSRALKSHINYRSKLIENAEVSKVVETKPVIINNNINVNGNNHCNGTSKKLSESDSLDLSSCGVSEDELESNLCEVKLSRGASGGVGVTLAGGSDCEAKNVTIHKVLQGSAAERDGRLCKGDRVISINGHSMKNVTHAQSVAILKEPLPEVSIVICSKRKDHSKSSEISNDSNKMATLSVVLNKTDDSLGSAGLGISLQGGGITPLVINKLFTGGVAANSGKIPVGCELLAVNNVRLTEYTRAQAWGLLRGLPVGPVTLLLRPP